MSKFTPATTKPVVGIAALEALDVRAGTIERVARQALFVVNLEPRKMAGEISEGVLFDIGYADGIHRFSPYRSVRFRTARAPANFYWSARRETLFRS